MKRHITDYLRRHSLLIVGTILVCLYLGRQLNPFVDTYFHYHDVTQPARVMQFAAELKRAHIPPQSAPDFAYGHAYPLFTFYAPTSYWITVIPTFLGFDVHQAIKLSFLAALAVAWIGMYQLARYLSKHHFNALLSASLYVASPWMASEIFVRGNLAEAWAMALLPLAVWSVINNDHVSVFTSSVILALAFTTHNALSLVFMAIIAGFVLISTHRGRAIKKYLWGLGMALGFWGPVVVGLSGTHAREIAVTTRYADHFLCIDQLWTSVNGWGYGGSAAGCLQDGMSFMVGKLLIIIGIGAFIVCLWVAVRRRFVPGWGYKYLLIALVTILSLFAMTGSSKPLWDVLTPLQSFQFPWRFNLTFIWGLATLTTIYGYIKLRPIWLLNVIYIILSLGVIVTQAKFFVGDPATRAQIYELSTPTYIRTEAAYRVPEYLPKTVEYGFFQSLHTGHEPSPRDMDTLSRAFAAYKPPTILYTTFHIISLAIFLAVICLQIYPTIRKKA